MEPSGSKCLARIGGYTEERVLVEPREKPDVFSSADEEAKVQTRAPARQARA